MTNICGEFHENPSSTYRDITSLVMVLTDGRTEGRAENLMLPPSIGSRRRLAWHR